MKVFIIFSLLIFIKQIESGGESFEFKPEDLKKLEDNLSILEGLLYDVNSQNQNFRTEISNLIQELLRPNDVDLTSVIDFLFEILNNTPAGGILRDPSSSKKSWTCQTDFKSLINGYDNELNRINNRIKDLQNEIKTFQAQVQKTQEILKQIQLTETGNQGQVINQLKNTISLAQQAITSRQQQIGIFVQKTRDTNIIKNMAQAFKGSCDNGPKPKAFPIICNMEVFNSIGTTNTNDIFAPDGKYIKTACYVKREFSYDDAQRNCEKYGMTLYRFNDKNSYDGLIAHVSKIWGPFGGASFWINGKQSNLDHKFWSLPDNKPLYSGMNFLESTQPFTCLRLFIPERVFGVTSFRCAGGMTSWCEFNKFA